MKFEISTVKFQDMLRKAVNGASFEVLQPLSTYIGIEVKDNELMLTTTDASNFMYVKEKVDNGEDGYVTIALETLAKLVPKITSETIKVSLEERFLNLKGNGAYKLEIPMENGEIIHFPNPEASAEMHKIGDVSLVDIKMILASVKPSLATTFELPFYTNYYSSDIVVGTDNCKASSYNKQVLDGKPRLLNVNIISLLNSMTDDTIEVYTDESDTKIKFVSSNCTVYGTTPSGIEDYNIVGVTTLLQTEFPHSCQVSKSVILGALDRIKLFVGAYDEGAITLSFDKSELTISSKYTTGIEEIPYVQPIDGEVSFTGEIEINSFYTQIHSQVSDTVNLQFGLPNALKLVGDDITSVVALFN